VQCPYLIGHKVYLRPLERADAPLVQPWINDPEVRYFIRAFRPVNLQAEEDFITKANQDEHSLVLGIAVKANDRLVGAAGLQAIDFRSRHASFGIAIGVPSEWSKGYGTEATRLLVRHAFETLNLNRVWLQVYEDNPRGIRAYEKAGFRKEGVLRQDMFRAGRYWDTIVMAILREEWQKMKDEG
jgi:[ribosomal protein S5]-alanine N-acetyltransferase